VRRRCFRVSQNEARGQPAVPRERRAGWGLLARQAAALAKGAPESRPPRRVDASGRPCPGRLCRSRERRAPPVSHTSPTPTHNHPPIDTAACPTLIRDRFFEAGFDDDVLLGAGGAATSMPTSEFAKYAAMGVVAALGIAGFVAKAYQDKKMVGRSTRSTCLTWALGSTPAGVCRCVAGSWLRGASGHGASGGARASPGPQVAGRGLASGSERRVRLRGCASLLQCFNTTARPTPLPSQVERVQVLTR
jgi:hypothetical protein